MRSRRTYAAALPLAALLACSPAPKASKVQSDAPVPVRVRKPERVERPAYVRVSGAVEARLSVEAAFQVSGKVARVLVEEGQFVRRGQLLAELDDRDYRDAQRAAQAQTDAALATERKAEAGPRKEELEQARIDLANWQDQYDRMRFLYERKSLPAADFNKIEAAYKAARERFQMAQSGTRVEDKAAAQAVRRGAEAQASVASKRLADSKLLAPISGYVGLRRIDPGEAAGAGIPVFAILELDPVYVRAGIPEAEIGMVRQGAPVTVSIPSLDNREFGGKVELVGVAADPASRTFPVKVTVPNPERVLRAGMVAEARIEGKGRVAALTLPGEAIVRDPQGATLVYVYYPERKRVYAKRVEPGAPLGREIEIRGGLEGGELVVVAGQHNVREGSAADVTGETR
jgi:multidrug efflux pump subunit AcrA (membrane-fusion protein)